VNDPRPSLVLPVLTSLLAATLNGACGESSAVPSPLLSADGIEHSERIALDEPVGFETPSGVNGIETIAISAGDSTLVTSMAKHLQSYTEPATGLELTEHGALAVHELRSSRWVETAFLTHPSSEREQLGYYVAADDQTIIASVGGFRKIDSHPTGVAIFEKSAGEWTLTQTFENLGCVAGLTVDGDIAAVADCCPDPASSEGEVPVGRAHVFGRSEGRWSKTQELKTSRTDVTNRMGSRFAGIPIALHRGDLVMGVPFYTAPGSDLYESGIAFVFHASTGSFRERWILEPKNPERSGLFGDSVDIHDGLIAVSAIGENEFKGRVHLFSQETGWKFVTSLSPENTRGLHGFGWSISIRDSRLLVGAPSERGEQRGINNYAAVDPEGLHYGAAYLFVHRYGDGWKEKYYLKAARPPHWGDGFGAGVVLTETQALVGGSGQRDPGFIHVWTLTN